MYREYGQAGEGGVTKGEDGVKLDRRHVKQPHHSPGRPQGSPPRSTPHPPLQRHGFASLTFSGMLKMRRWLRCLLRASLSWGQGRRCPILCLLVQLCVYFSQCPPWYFSPLLDLFMPISFLIWIVENPAEADNAL